MADKISTLPTMAEMTSMYLFGQLEKPNNLLDENLIRPKDLVVDYPVKININEYMTDGAGRFVSAKDFKFLDEFFTKSSTASENLEAGRYTKSEIIQTLKIKFAGVTQSTAEYDDGKDDLFERAYIWNSVAFMVNDDAVFVIDEDGNRFIENFAIVPFSNDKPGLRDENGKPMDNFDFTGGDTSNIANAAIGWKIDPSGIGRKVNIKFDWDNIDTKTLSYQDYLNENESSNFLSEAWNQLTVGWDSTLTNNLIRRLWDTEVIQFLDEENRIILYGTQDNDKFTFNPDDTQTSDSSYGEHYFYKELLKLYTTLNNFNTPNGIVFIAVNGNDTIVGTVHNDRLIGGDGIDLLDGGEGADQLDGGKGFDTYIAGDGDSIFDSDGDGQVVVNMGDSDNLEFYAYALGSTIWYEVDQNKQRTGSYASRKEADLIIYKHEENKLITIIKFFDVAKHKDSYYSSLNITLQTETETDPEKINYSEFTQNGRFDKYCTFSIFDENAHAKIYCGEKDDVITASSSAGVMVYGDNGNDKVFGSFYTDIIYGGSGSDYLYGSSYNPNNQRDEKAKQLDKDIIIGEEGRDFIFGVAGDDEIHTGYKNEHTIKEGNNQAGDWAIGGEGDDFIFGSKNRDFLQGSEGSDILYGGASDDIVIGDSFIRFGLKSKSLYNTEVIEYQLRSNNNKTQWTQQTTKGGSILDNSMNDWDIEIDSENGDYILHTAVNLYNNEHIVTYSENTNYNDTLWGGSGNDLIIGQYGNDNLFGEEGNDILWGDDNRDNTISGNDYLDGGAGNDKLHGGKGNDTYAFGENWGQDIIWDILGKDSIILSINPDDIELIRDGINLIIKQRNTENQINIQNQFYSKVSYAINGIEEIQFADGSTWTQSHIENRLQNGTSNNDKLNGTSGNDTLRGTLNNDTLQGGLGSDTYILSGDFGHDTIIETNPNNNDKNKIEFSDTSIKDYQFIHNNNNLIISNGNNSVTINDFYDQNDGKKIDQFQFNDITIDNALASFFGDNQSGKNITYTENGDNIKTGLFNGRQFIVASDDANINTSLFQDAVVVTGENVIVNTGANNDKIYINGSGDIEGGIGSDEYIIGQDFSTVNINDATGIKDQLHFTNLNLDDLFISKQGKNLIFQSLENADSKVVIENQNSLLNRIKNINFENGSNLSHKDINKVADIYQQYDYNQVASDLSLRDSIMQQIEQQHLIG
ncbi:MAG: hypothetical protein IKI22_05745 [Neisseriaceae bacterium]|nr:hypothetical protein [Neisseriaceae bacterium]